MRVATELAWLKQLFDAQADHIAVLDAEGRIIAVNEAWKRFARDNGAEGGEAYLGSNYLTICNSARGEGADIAKACYQGLKEVLAGERTEFSLEYPCHSATLQRWFRLKALPLEPGAAIIHTDISGLEQKNQHDAKLQSVLLATTNELLTQEVTPEFYQRLLEQAVTLIPGAQAGSVTVRGEDNRFHFVAAVGFDLAGLSQVSFDENELFFADKDISVRGSYLVYGVDTINLKRLDAKRLEQLREAGHAQRIKVTLGVPIYISDQISATLSFDSLDDANAFDQEARKIAEALGTQVGLILHDLREKDSLKKSEELFSTLFHQSPTPTFLVSLAEHRFMDANESALKLLGYAREEIIGKDVLDFDLVAGLGKSEANQQIQVDKAQLSRGEVKPITEQQLHTKSGAIRTVLGNASPIQVSGQMAVLVTFADITEQVQSREALRQSEALFSTLFHQNPTPVLLTSIPDFRVVDANQSLLELVDYEADEVIGKEFFKLPIVIDPRSHAGAERLARGEAVPLEEIHLSSKSGTVRTVLRNALPIVVNGQHLALVTLVDITERKRTEEQLTQAIQEVMQDAEWFSHSVMEKLAQMRSRGVDKTEATELTEREYQVLALIAKGKDNTDIGKDLGISPQTVRNYVSQIYSKLGIRSRAEAVVWARERGLVS